MPKTNKQRNKNSQTNICTLARALINITTQNLSESVWNNNEWLHHISEV